MSIREKFSNAMRRKSEDYVPFEFRLCPSLLEEFKKRTGVENYAEYYKFPARGTKVESLSDFARYHKYFKDLTDVTVGDWGIGRKKGSVEHFTRMLHPMESFETIEEFEQYPYPDPVKDYDWSSYPAKVADIKQSDLIAVAQMEVTIFETAWYMRGMEQFMVDMAINPELANYHLDRITQNRCEFAKRYAKAGCDVLRLGDDVSTQLDMMMAPDTWREFIKPRLAKVIKAAKEQNPEIMIFYHGDGNLQKIIPDLIEIGVEILNPVQPECMDPVEIKQRYGDKLSFWGTLGTQTVMPFGSPEDVKQVCMRMIKEVGKGGGLLLAPTHMLEPEVPWENIEAFLSTVREHNDR